MWRQRPKALELLIMYGLTTKSLTSTMRRWSSHYIFRIFTLFVSLPFEDHSSSNQKLVIPIFFSQGTFKFWSWLILAAFVQFLHILSYPIFRKALLFFIRKLQTRSYKLVLKTSVTNALLFLICILEITADQILHQHPVLLFCYVASLITHSLIMGTGTRNSHVHCTICGRFSYEYGKNFSLG